MEYTCMEITQGALASLAAFVPTQAGAESSSAWHTWLRRLVLHRWASATAGKYGMWANIVARALRFLANELAGFETFAAELPARDAGKGLLAVVDVALELSNEWSGDSGADAKCAMVLNFCIDHLLQVCPSRANGCCSL